MMGEVINSWKHVQSLIFALSLNLSLKDMLYSPISRVSVLLLLSVGSFILPACDSSEFNAVEEVLVIGTRVPLDFLDSGQFELVVTPLDAEGNAVLTNELEVEVDLDIDLGAMIPTIITGVESNEEGETLAMAIVLDASDSMDHTDPDNLRISGAQQFVRVLDAEASLWEAAVFDFPGGSPGFDVTTLLHPYSSDLTSLIDALENAGSFGSTPTYDALDEILRYSEGLRPTVTYERGLVLLSDGNPNNNTVTREQVCDLANAQDSPIYSIGLGPASDISPDAEQAAVEEMRFLSDCTGGAYAGITPDDATAVETIYSSIATATVLGTITIQVSVPQDILEQFGPNEAVGGTITLAHGGGEASGRFRFNTPFGALLRPDAYALGVDD